MKNFRRSLRYLWPYRSRIALGLVCVLMLAVLWGGGLGMILPGAKILVSPEGLHGWAYLTLATDRLGISGDRLQLTQERRTITDQPLSVVFEVNEVQVGSPAYQAGLRSGMWIIGLAARSGLQLNPPVTPADVVVRQIALSPPDKTVDLTVIDPMQGAIEQTKLISMSVPLRQAKSTSWFLGWLAGLVPEPVTFQDRFLLFVQFMVVFLVLTYTRALFEFIQEYLVSTTVWRGIMDLRCDNYNRAIRLPLTFFLEKGTNDTMSRFIQDTNELARGQITLFGKTLAEPAKAVAAMVVALVLSWQLTLIAFIAGPPAFLLVRAMGKKIHRASRKALEGWSSMLAVLEETLTGIRIVKAYTMEGAERKRFFQVNRRLLRQQYKMERIDASTGPAIESLGLTFGMLAAAGAGWRVFSGKMDPLTFLAWLGTLFALFDPVRKLSKVANRFQQAEAAAKRIFELSDAKDEPRGQSATMLPRHSKSIELKNVSYRYTGAENFALSDINLFVRAGITVAIVGPNGGGKTTLVSLIPRLLVPSSGQILIDDLDIADCSLRSLRRQIGLVSQETVLFHATIGENIAYGLRRPNREQVLLAARRAFVDEFVQQMPDGYNTMVGEHGSTLSGGQKQRIAIARAILRDPSILIFDEAMSQTDSDSERRIHQAMQEFTKGRTTFVIAHRFATVLSADLIVVLAGGKIVGQGSHQELLEGCKLYRHLYNTQFVDSGGTDVPTS